MSSTFTIQLPPSVWSQMKENGGSSPSTPVKKEEGKRVYTTPNTTPERRAPGQKAPSPMPTIDETVTILFSQTFQNASPAKKSKQTLQVPQNTPVTPDSPKEERLPLGQFKPRALFQNNSTNSP